MKYIFGRHNSSDDVYVVKAPSLKAAIELFNTDVLFPEPYVCKESVKSRNYNYVLERYDYVFNENPYIEVYDENTDTCIHKLPLYDCINVEYSKLSKVAGLLTTEEKEVTDELPVVKDRFLLKSITNKMTFREMKDKIKTTKHDLQLQIQKLNEATALLEEELTQKRKLIYVLYTYLGENEEVYQLCSGMPADDAPLYVFQQVLYMDEEIGIWENKGIDFNDIDKFDEWISKNYDKFLYKEKSVCVFQVRRRSDNKDYGDIWSAMYASSENRKTYFLIRNGENLYRIWSNVYLHETVFPKSDEYEKILNESEHFKKRNIKRVKLMHETFLYGLFALQGLIDRTEIFGTNLKNKVNLVNGTFNDLVFLVRDAEQEHWLSDGKLSWSDFITKNRSTITQGTRVVISQMNTYKDDSLRQRTYPYRNAPWPSQMEVYQIEKLIDKKNYFGTSYVIKYKPAPSQYSWEHEWKIRIPYKLYSDEVLNFDAITLEDCDYYLHNRIERPNYLSILPVLFYVRNLKLKEKHIDDNFIKLIAADLKIDEKDYNRIRDAIDWWKLKNKWKRGLLKDDAKAVRMIKKKICNEMKLLKRSGYGK